MKRVFITQSPMRRNLNGELVHMYDLTPARVYGNLEILLPAGPVVIDTESASKTLRQRLGGFTPDDHLLCLGDPVIIAAASAMVADINGGIIPLLVWDRQQRLYLSVRIDIHQRLVI